MSNVYAFEVEVKFCAESLEDAQRKAKPMLQGILDAAPSAAAYDCRVIDLPYFPSNGGKPELFSATEKPISVGKR